MEGCANALISNLQKPCSALITEHAEVKSSVFTSAEHFFFSELLQETSTEKAISIATQAPPIIEMGVWWKLVYAHIEYLRSSCPLGNLFLPVQKHPKSIFTSLCLTVKQPHLQDDLQRLGFIWEVSEVYFPHCDSALDGAQKIRLL